MKGPPIMDFTNVERVEVVKGPASFLYGQVAPGGMVNLISKFPKEKFETSVTATYGSYNQYSGVVDVTGPIGGGFFYRVVGSYSHDIDYWDPYDSHQTVIAPQLLYKLSEKASLSLKFEKFEKRESPQLFQKRPRGLPGSAFSFPGSRRRASAARSLTSGLRLSARRALAAASRPHGSAGRTQLSAKHTGASARRPRPPAVRTRSPPEASALGTRRSTLWCLMGTRRPRRVSGCLGRGEGAAAPGFAAMRQSLLFCA